jgi:LIVCS family branched-chain amino acid:cation transporter
MLGSLKSNTVSTGLAMFSMFFGAGNIVFPLAIGVATKQNNHYAIIGLLLSAVLVPFLGLISMTVFDGNYRTFFSRIGTIPGMIVATLILALIGPFGALPRCIALSYATVQLFVPATSLIWFSLGSCVLIFVLTFRQSKILDILGFVLTPLLIISLLLIVGFGIMESPGIPEATVSPREAFTMGFLDGYQTMDLIGAFFFSSMVLICLQRELDPSRARPYHQLVILALKASVIGAGLLALFYMGFSYVAAFNADVLEGVSPQALLGTLALKTLGPSAGIIACTAAALACLTTAIALAAVFAQFLYHDVFRETLNYPTSLIITLVISFLISTWEFTGIAAMLQPILQICYPALIVLAIVNLLSKLTDFVWIKTPVYLTFLASLVLYLWNNPFTT